MNKRVALVTGGTRGIGAAISKRLKNEGYTVIATYQNNKERADKFSEETGIPTFCWDVSDYASCEERVKEIEAKHGHIDILVNNAGITRDSFFHKMDEQKWSDVISINLNSCFNMCQSVVNGMRDRKFGRIINVSSINGQTGQYGQTNYSAAKAGIIGFTKSLALETAQKGITVNAVAPGYIKTDMVAAVKPEVLDQIVSNIPVGRLGSPDDIANAVSFLAQDDASFITGSTLTINGGQYLT
jgi:acetoacetyl-CoA reductase